MRNTNKRFHILASGLTLLVLLTGCGEEKKEETKSVQSKSTQVNQAASIEVMANENAQEIKVKEKKTDKTQSKSYYYDYNIKSEYDQNARPANEDASVRAKPRTKIDANLNIRSPYEHVEIELLVKRLSVTFRIRCSACHDDYANGIIGPSLLARDAEYIYNKISEFKSGKKSNPLMEDLIHMMSDDEIHTLANEIYEFNQEVKKIREKK
jgi:mono/diheme cytochrome c family protein